VEKWTVKDVPVRTVNLAIREKVDLDKVWGNLNPGQCLDHGIA